MKRHWVAKLFPALSPGEYAALKVSIAAHGLREPIKTWRGAIVDGVHRERACRETKVQRGMRNGTARARSSPTWWI
jgi:ParB-like chromosome segregation protein Spo0J